MSSVTTTEIVKIILGSYREGSDREKMHISQVIEDLRYVANELEDLLKEGYELAEWPFQDGKGHFLATVFTMSRDKGKVKGRIVEIDPELAEKLIEELDLPTLTKNALTRQGVKTVGELMSDWSEPAALLKIKNFGQKSLKKLKEELDKLGLSLR